jgi:phosphate transport system substrate-binding protein
MCHVLRLIIVYSLGVSATMAADAGKIVIDGSTGVTPLVAALAKAYQSAAPGTLIEIGKGLGTKARIQALAAGKIDIAMASHGLNVAEIQRQGMAVHEIGKVAVVFAVNTSVPVTGLSETQICDIYSGKTKNWKEVGGPDLGVVAVARPDSEVDTEVVRDKVTCLTALKMAESVRIAPKAGEMAQELASTAGAIGVTTMTVVEQSQTRVKPVSLRGIMPTAENVQKNVYTLTRDSFLVVKSPPAAAVARFLEYIRSPAGETVIAANGAVPVK